MVISPLFVVSVAYRYKKTHIDYRTVRLETRYIDVEKSISIIDRKFYIVYIDNLRQHYLLYLLIHGG